MRGEPVAGSKFGFFSRPVLVGEGPHAGKVVKVYRAVSSRSRCEDLCAHHALHVRQLRDIGIVLPNTEMTIEPRGDQWQPIIIQDYFPPGQMAKSRVARVARGEALDLMQGILQDALKALAYVEHHGDRRFGFHPTLRNYAVAAGTLNYLDTFPPMSDYCREEVAAVVLEFVPRGLPGFLKFLGRPYLKTVIDEYFRADVMLQGIVGSTCRLRPRDSDAIISRAREIIAQAPTLADRERVLRRLARPPRLGPVWMLGRKYFERIHARAAANPPRCP